MSSDDKLRKMLLDAVAQTMKLDAVPEHALNTKELVAELEARGYRFSRERLRDTVKILIKQGIVKTARSGNKTYYWFVEETT